MDEKMTMEITNDRLEEAIKQYAAERTKENLTTVLNLLRPTKLYVPAMLKAPDQPTPCFLKNNKGEQFFVHVLPRSRCRRAEDARHFFSCRSRRATTSS